MIKTFTTYFETEALDEKVNDYLKELKAKKIKYEVQTSSAATQHVLYYTVTVISEE